MQLGTEIGKMTRKLFTRFSKSRPWMLATGCNAARSPIALLAVFGSPYHRRPTRQRT